MTTSTREDVLEEVAARIPVLGRPVLVAVDGVDGSGKTTFADELAAVVEASGRFGEVVRASVDGFHHPKAHRHALGRTGETFWSRSYDYPALLRELVGPWRSGPGSGRLRSRILITGSPSARVTRALPPTWTRSPPMVASPSPPT